MKIIAISRPDPQECQNLGEMDSRRMADAHDRFNRPRERRNLILSSLSSLYPHLTEITKPTNPHENLNLFKLVHGVDLVEFLESAWDQWLALGDAGRDPQAFHHTYKDTDNMNSEGILPPLVPIHCMLQRDVHQIPSTHVIGKMAYYCTDVVTPIVPTLVEELTWDVAVVEMSVEESLKSMKKHEIAVVYAITTHPGHHCSYDVFGGYCYLNNAALAAKLFQVRGQGVDKVAILDVDYHCGNGTASMFYQDPSVFVVSLHCDPNFDYPFNSGFADQTGIGAGEGTTLHIPLKPGTTWDDAYQAELSRAMDAIVVFGAQALVVSLGLDTHDGDPVAIRRAGFHLADSDYVEMGKVIGAKLQGKIPIVFVQEGGYKVRFERDCLFYRLLLNNSNFDIRWMWWEKQQHVLLVDVQNV